LKRFSFFENVSILLIKKVVNNKITRTKKKKIHRKFISIYITNDLSSSLGYSSLEKLESTIFLSLYNQNIYIIK